MDLREIADWIRLAQDRVRWQVFEDAVMNLWIS
jgi:hypothetical protein